MAYSVPVGDTKTGSAGGALDKKAVSSARTAKGHVFLDLLFLVQTLDLQFLLQVVVHHSHQVQEKGKIH